METQVIEINGIKLEVDMRYAKRIDTFRVGSKVKLLVKSDYGDPQVKSGVVVGFEPFESFPTIIVAYLDISYGSSDLKIAYVNAGSEKKYELVQSLDDELPISKADVLQHFDRERAKLQEQLEELGRKRDYFLRHFNQYFETEKTEA